MADGAEALAWQAAMEEARDWMRRLGAPDYSETTRDAFMAWIMAEPHHEAAFRQASSNAAAAGFRTAAPPASDPF